MRKIAMVFAVMAVALTARAYTTIRGSVVDAMNTPQIFATYRVYQLPDTMKALAYGTTDENGLFECGVSDPGEYRIVASVVGLKPGMTEFKLEDDAAHNAEKKLEPIVCNSESTLLGEVTVTAARPLVTHEIDRIGYDVKADVEARTSSLQDVLRKVPLVSVDPEGNIQVKGSSDFKIYKNGRPNNSFTKNAKDIFRALPASTIKRIEVITDPGAREDAEGTSAILNIVTDSQTQIKGYMANVGIHYDSRQNVPGVNLWGSTQVDKLTVSVNGGSNHNASRSLKVSDNSVSVYEETGNILHSRSNSRVGTQVYWWGIDGSYELDSLNLFTLEYSGYSFSNHSKKFGATEFVSKDLSPIYSYGEETVTKPFQYLDFNGSFNYQHSTHRKGETMTLSYMISTTNQHNKSQTTYKDMVNMPVSYTGITSNFKLDFMEHTLQADWTRPFANIHVIDLGVKYIFRDNHSNTTQDYVGSNYAPVSDFTHRTHIAAGFADYRVRLNKFMIRGGLRYEFSRLQAKFKDGSEPDFASNLSDLVPNAAVSYSINGGNTIKASFNTRINRPGITYLSPAVSETPNSVSTGNPDLGSSRNNNLSINYSLMSRKVMLEFSSGYSFSTNTIISEQHVVGDRLYSSYANAGHNKAVELSVFLQWSASAKTRVMLNGGASYNHYSNPSFGISKAGWGGNLYARFTQQLPWKVECNVGLGMWNMGPTLYSHFKAIGTSGTFHQISFSRNFMKQDRLSVRLMVNNPFRGGRSHYRNTTYNVPLHTVTDQYNSSQRSVMIGLSYRLGSLNASVKKTSAKITNDDLQGRKAE